MKIQEKIVTLKSGDKISLRSPIEEDAEQLLSFVRQLSHESSDTLNQTANHFDDFTVEQERKVIKSREDALNGFMITVFFKENVVGNIGLNGSHFSLKKHCGEMGMGILKSMQNRGLGWELLIYFRNYSA